MMNSQDIFAIALGLEESWNINEVRFDKENLQFGYPSKVYKEV